MFEFIQTYLHHKTRLLYEIYGILEFIHLKFVEDLLTLTLAF